jgi:hypothetical protein
MVLVLLLIQELEAVVVVQTLVVLLAEQVEQVEVVIY